MLSSTGKPLNKSIDASEDTKLALEMKNMTINSNASNAKFLNSDVINEESEDFSIFSDEDTNKGEMPLPLKKFLNKYDEKYKEDELFDPKVKVQMTSDYIWGILPDY